MCGFISKLLYLTVNYQRTSPNPTTELSPFVSQPYVKSRIGMINDLKRLPSPPSKWAVDGQTITKCHVAIVIRTVLRQS